MLQKLTKLTVCASIFMLLNFLLACAMSPKWSENLDNAPSNPEKEIRSIVKIGDDIHERVRFLKKKGWRVTDPDYGTVENSHLVCVVEIGRIGTAPQLLYEVMGIETGLQGNPYIAIYAKPDGTVFKLD